MVFIKFSQCCGAGAAKIEKSGAGAAKMGGSDNTEFSYLKR